MMGDRDDPSCKFALRCTQSGCPCDGFAPGFKGCKRTCSTCHHGWISHALDKVLLDHHLPLDGTSSLTSSRISAAYDLASLILFGTTALPVKLKILLDALLSSFNEAERAQLLQGFGWTLQDFSRGYIHKDPHGNRLMKWTIVNKEEEGLVMQHFLKFSETKSLAEGFLREEEQVQSSSLQEDGGNSSKGSSSGSSHPLLLETAASDIMKFIERANKESLRSQSKHNNSLRQGNFSSPPSAQVDSRHQRRSSPSSLRHHHHHLPSSSPEGPQAGASSPNNNNPSSLNNNRRNSSPPASSSLMHGIQPFDFRKMFSGSKGLEGQDANELFRASKKHAAQQLAMMGFPAGGVLDMEKSQPVSGGPIPPSSVSINSEDQSMSDDASGDEDNSEGAMNLSVGGFDPKEARNRKSNNPMKRRWNPMVLSSLVTNPATGKRRVQCHACFKTFCDKGALKIHFSAVHLREMHKCTVDGCTMMFSSRRSRNRHSANPNPKLHSSSLRRKLNPHDGRTSNPYPNPLSLSGGPPSPSLLGLPAAPLAAPGGHHLKQSARMMLDQQNQQRFDDFEKMGSNVVTERSGTASGNNGSSQAAGSMNDMMRDNSFRSSSCSPCPSDLSETDPSLASKRLKPLRTPSFRPERAVSDSNGHHHQRQQETGGGVENAIQRVLESDANRVRKRKSANPTKFSSSTSTAAANISPTSDDEMQYSSDDDSSGTFMDSRMGDTNGLNDSEDDDEDDSLQELINLQRQKALRKMMEYNQLKRLNRETCEQQHHVSNEKKEKRHNSSSSPEKSHHRQHHHDRDDSPPDNFVSGGQDSANNNHHHNRKDSRSLSSSSSLSDNKRENNKVMPQETSGNNNSFHDQKSKQQQQLNPADFLVQGRSDGENPLRHLESLSMGFNNLISPNSHLRNSSLFGNPGGLPFPPGLGIPPFSLPPSSLPGGQQGLVPPTASSSNLPSPPTKRTPTSSSSSSTNNNHEGSCNEGKDGEECMQDDGSNDSSERRGSGQEDEYSMFKDSSLTGMLDIPVDKENPRRCVACGKIFQNHFGVKTHYQNVHLKLMHKCTVDGCNAAFPSKRSRDRHSSNLNLHRKLLSTHSDKGIPYGFVGEKNSFFPFNPSSNLRDEFMSRFYDTQGLPLNLGDIYQGRLPGFGPEGLLAAAAAGFPGVPGFGPPFPLGIPPGMPGMILPGSAPGEDHLREERGSPLSSAGSSHSSPRSKYSTSKKQARSSSTGQRDDTDSLQNNGSIEGKLLLDQEKLRMMMSMMPSNNNREDGEEESQATGRESPASLTGSENHVSDQTVTNDLMSEQVIKEAVV